MRDIMQVPFIKMHGLGNDFVVLDAREQELPDISEPIAKAISDRKEGIGCDQLILLEPSERYDFRMRIFNADGGEVEACGNASRAVALLHGEQATVGTAGGTITLSPGDSGAMVHMGMPRFDWEAIPLAYAMDTAYMPVGWGDGDSKLENPMAVNVGNPHVVFFVEDVDAVDLETLGPEIENDPLFPERVNVNVASIEAKDHVHLRVWERGVGLTRACGTGACATAVAAMRRGHVIRTTTVSLPGGDLRIEWDAADRIRMTGPAKEAFRGTFEWGNFA